MSFELVTIRVHIHPSSFNELVKVLKVLDGLEIENGYEFDPALIEYKEKRISNWYEINIPLDLYLKFKYAHSKLRNR